MEPRPDLHQLRTTSFDTSNRPTRSRSHRSSRKRDRTPFPDEDRKASLVSTAPSTPVTRVFSARNTPCASELGGTDSISTDNSERSQKSQQAVDLTGDDESRLSSVSASLESEVEPDSAEEIDGSVPESEEQDIHSARESLMSSASFVQIEAPEYKELSFRPPYPLTINCSRDINECNAVLPGLSVPVDELAYRHDGSLGLSYTVSNEISKRMVQEDQDDSHIQGAFVRFIVNKWVDNASGSGHANGKLEDLGKNGSSLNPLVPTNSTDDSTPKVEALKHNLPILDRLVIPGSGPRIEFPEAIITASDLRSGRCCLSIGAETAAQYMENATIWLPEEESVLYNYVALSSLPRQDGSGVIHESGVGVDIVRQHIRLGRWVWILSSKGELDVLRTAAFYEAKRLHLEKWITPLERFSRIDEPSFDYSALGRLNALLAKKIENFIAVVAREEARVAGCGTEDVGDLSNPFLGPQNEVAVKVKEAVAERERLALQDKSLEDFREWYEARSYSQKVSQLMRNPKSELAFIKMLKTERQPTALEIHLARVEAKHAAINEAEACLTRRRDWFWDEEPLSLPPPKPFVHIEMEKPTWYSRRNGKRKATGGRRETSFIGLASKNHSEVELESLGRLSIESFSWDQQHQSSPPKGSEEYKKWFKELDSHEPPAWVQKLKCPRPMGKSTRIAVVPRDVIRRRWDSTCEPPAPVRLEHVIEKIKAEELTFPLRQRSAVSSPAPEPEKGFLTGLKRKLQMQRKVKEEEIAKTEKPVLLYFGDWRAAWLGDERCHIPS